MQQSAGAEPGAIATPRPDARTGADGKVVRPAAGAYAGVFTPPAPYDLSALDRYADKYGHQPAIVMWYQPWAKGAAGEFSTDEANAVLKRGSIPLVTWEPWAPGDRPHELKNPANDPSFALSRIIAGDYDASIRRWARAAGAVDGPIMLRPMHEMNGNWYPWGGTVNTNSAARFIAAWRHVHDIFDAEGATNVTWVWSVNWLSVPDTRGNAWANYYPGDEYVDWTAISGFNWGRTRLRRNGASFASMYTKPVAYLESLGKPILVSETACNTGVDKPAWIADAYERIEDEYPAIGGVVYYDKPEKGVNGAQNWQIGSSPASAKAYRSALSSEYFVGASGSSLLRSQDGAAKP
ncbi:MAG: hypothetical protein HGB10_06570 [Coriobacteriia bacterium]|nr:hypothetical protein [Coriobacteriia bacterium]